MKTILSTLMAAGILAGAASLANAQQFDPFTDNSLALPRSDVSNDAHREALPRSGAIDPFTDPALPLPLTDETFPDIVIATP